jgi:hypothetical protein
MGSSELYPTIPVVITAGQAMIRIVCYTDVPRQRRWIERDSERPLYWMMIDRRRKERKIIGMTGLIPIGQRDMDTTDSFGVAGGPLIKGAVKLWESEQEQQMDENEGRIEQQSLS